MFKKNLKRYPRVYISDGNLLVHFLILSQQFSN